MLFPISDVTGPRHFFRGYFPKKVPILRVDGVHHHITEHLVRRLLRGDGRIARGAEHREEHQDQAGDPGFPQNIQTRPARREILADG